MKTAEGKNAVSFFSFVTLLCPRSLITQQNRQAPPVFPSQLHGFDLHTSAPCSPPSSHPTQRCQGKRCFIIPSSCGHYKPSPQQLDGMISTRCPFCLPSLSQPFRQGGQRCSSQGTFSYLPPATKTPRASRKLPHSAAGHFHLTMAIKKSKGKPPAENALAFFFVHCILPFRALSCLGVFVRQEKNRKKNPVFSFRRQNLFIRCDDHIEKNNQLHSFVQSLLKKSYTQTRPPLCHVHSSTGPSLSPLRTFRMRECQSLPVPSAQVKQAWQASAPRIATHSPG